MQLTTKSCHCLHCYQINSMFFNILLVVPVLYILYWTRCWGNVDSGNVDESGGKLTNKIFGALMHTTYALSDVSEYCLNELTTKYVLLGKFQTDCFESQLGQYHNPREVDMIRLYRQVYEFEIKIRLMSVLKLQLSNANLTLSDFTLNWNEYELTTTSNSFPIPIKITKADADHIDEDIKVVTYIGGYCCYAINKKLKCEECKTLVVYANGNENKFKNSLIKQKAWIEESYYFLPASLSM